MARGALSSVRASWNATVTARAARAPLGGTSIANAGTSATPNCRRTAAAIASCTRRWTGRIMRGSRGRRAVGPARKFVIRLQFVTQQRLELVELARRVHVDEETPARAKA